MIEPGRGWQARQLSECAQAEASAHPFSGADSHEQEPATQAAYAQGVADIL
jgi:hypothetical protein